MGAIKELAEYKNRKESILQGSGFRVSKEWNVSSTQYPQGEFLIDDSNKKFAIRYLESKRTKNPFILYKYTPIFRVYNYSDLGPFELDEDGNTIAQGKGIASAIGGMAFGVVGAIVGSSGKRKSENTCTSLCVRISVNDLNNPRISLEFVNNELKKNSAAYKEKLQQAQELIGTLDYISTCV